MTHTSNFANKSCTESSPILSPLFPDLYDKQALFSARNMPPGFLGVHSLSWAPRWSLMHAELPNTVGQ